jgi:hypothetical protein
MKVHKLFPIVALTILAAIAAAAPITIPGLYSTGTAGEGALDPYYWLAASPYGPLSVYGVITDGFPIPPWIANNSSSRWISPTADARNDLVGYYTFRTTFNLTGFQPSTAVIVGQWSSDNSAEIWLNGVFTGIALNFENPYTNLYNFSITSGFQPGLNTLDFIVYNWPCGGCAPDFGNPVGLRVNIISATAEPVPEPGTFALIGAGLIGAGILGRRVRRD